MKKKRVLILGSSGMAGHVIYKYLNNTGKYDMGAVSRTQVEGIESIKLDIEDDLPTLANIVETARPDVVINCIGLLVKACDACPAEAVFVNSFFPHMLENITSGTTTKVIHLSSDCVFRGKVDTDSNYHEDDVPNEGNWYGRTKALGELINEKDLTLRLSIIGPELKDGVGLLQWFFKQSGEIDGYSHHYWNGVTTLELAKQLDKIIDTELNGLYHLAPDFKINKYDLLQIAKKVFNKEDVTINRATGETVNKALSNNRVVEYNPEIPSYAQQLTELKEWMELHGGY